MDSDSDCDIKISTQQTKKRKKTGRIQDVMKRLRLSTHELGPPCNCTRFKCFEQLSEVNLQEILRYFNSFGSVYEQNLYLCGLITVHNVQRRRNRNDESEANFHQASYSYKVRVKREDSMKDIPVCYKAFVSIHGITKGKVEHLQSALKNTGEAPRDRRGKHSAKTKQLDQNLHEKICQHIKSYKSRQSHYSLKDTRTILDDP